MTWSRLVVYTFGPSWSLSILHLKRLAVASLGAWCRSVAVSVYTCGSFLLFWFFFVSAPMYFPLAVYLWFVMWHNVWDCLFSFPFLLYSIWQVRATQWVVFYYFGSFIFKFCSRTLVFLHISFTPCVHMCCVDKLMCKYCVLSVIWVFGITYIYFKIALKRELLRYVSTHAERAWLRYFIW